MNNSNRQLRASSTIQKALIEVFSDGKIIDRDLEYNSFYITTISLSRDLKIANCYIRAYDTARRNKILSALTRSARTIRYMLNKYIDMKFSPELKFFYDHSLDKHFEVESIIKGLSEE